MTRSNRQDAAATRRRILDAARRALDDEGHISVPLRIIADKAGVTTGAVHYYWPQKRDLSLEAGRVNHSP